MDFHGLKRKDLQALCKKNKIKANMTNVAMADALQALPTVEDANGILTSLLKLKQLPKPKSTYEETLIEGVPHMQIPDTPVVGTEIRTYTRRFTTKKKTASESEPLDRVGFDSREDVVSLDSSSITSLGGGGMDGGDGVAEVESPPLDVVEEDRTAENHQRDKLEDPTVGIDCVKEKDALDDADIPQHMDRTVENEKHYGESPTVEEDRTVGDEQGKMDGGDVATLDKMMNHKDEKDPTVDINYDNETDGLDVSRPENMDRAVENEQQSGEVESPPFEEDSTVEDERGKMDGQDVSTVKEMDQEVQNEMDGQDLSTFANVDRTVDTEKVRNVNQTPEDGMDGVDVASTENVDRTMENDSAPILGIVEQPKKLTTVDSEDVNDRTAGKERKITGREPDFAGAKSSDLFAGEEKKAENDASEKLVDVPVVLECEGLDSIDIPIPLPVEAKNLGETWEDVATPEESVGEEAKIPDESGVGVNLTVESPEKESLSLGEKNLIPEESACEEKLMILSVSASSSSLNICTEGNMGISPEELSDGGEFGLEESKTDKNVEFEDLSLRQLRILYNKMSTSANANATDSEANKESDNAGSSDVSVPDTTEAATAVNEKVDTINTIYGENTPNQLRKSISIKSCLNLASDKATTASACKEIHIDGENSGYGDISLRKLKSSCKRKMAKELADEMGILHTGSPSSAAAKVMFTVQGQATPTSIGVANSCRSGKVVRGSNNVHGSKGGKSISKLASDKATTASACKLNEINREKSGHQNTSLSMLKSLYKSKMPTEIVMGTLDICSRITQAANATPTSKALASNNKAFGSKSKGFSNLASNKAAALIHKSNTSNGENSACRSMRHRKPKSSYKSEASKKMINKTGNLDILSPSSAAAEINLSMQEQATPTNNKVNSSHHSCCENSCQGDMSPRKLRSSFKSKVSNQTVEKAGNLDILSPRSKVAKLKLSVQDQATPTSNKVDSSYGGSCENSRQGGMRRLRSSYKSKVFNGTIEKTGHLDILSPSSVAAKLMLSVQDQATPNRSKIGSSYCSNKVLVSNNSVHGSKSMVGSRSKGTLGILDEKSLKNPGKP